MKYDPNLTKEKLKGVASKNRVFIYNAEIILEFLEKTFMPTGYFLNSEGLKTLSIGKEMKPFLFNNPKDLQEQKKSLGDIYELYKIFRQQSPYTTPVESRYKFSVILKKLCLLKNGWQFHVRRHTRGQIVYFSPVLLRIHAPIEERREHIPGDNPSETPTVEVTQEDHEAEVPEEIVIENGESNRTETWESEFKQEDAPTTVEELPPNTESDGY